MPSKKLEMIKVAKHFIVLPSINGNNHRVFMSDGTLIMEIETFPSSTSEDEVILNAKKIAGDRKIEVDRNFNPNDLSRFFK